MRIDGRHSRDDLSLVTNVCLLQGILLDGTVKGLGDWQTLPMMKKKRVASSICCTPAYEYLVGYVVLQCPSAGLLFFPDLLSYHDDYIGIAVACNYQAFSVLQNNVKLIFIRIP